MYSLKNIILLFLSIVAAVAGSSCSGSSPEQKVSAAVEQPALASDSEVAAVLKYIDKNPDLAIGHSSLAIIYVKRARESGDFSLNTQAQMSLDRALKIAPDDLTAQKLQAGLFLTFHKFAEGLELAEKLQKSNPNDAFLWGVVTDANAELGNYDEAVAAAQKMVDLKPNAASYARAAHLRSLHGDHPGAVEMYKLAARITDPIDKESQSWCLTQLGNEFLRNGNYAEAEKIYDEALRNFPDYHLAMVGKGRSQAAAGDFAAAARFVEQARARVPSTDNTILLGDIYTRQGDQEKAREMYSTAEAGGEKLGELHDAHRLALHWADNNINAAEALQIARDDYAVVKDIYAADILAWCLYKNGLLPEAKAKIEEAMRLKTSDARIWFHAGMIEKGLGNRSAARGHLEKALKLDPSFDILRAAEARNALLEL